MTLEDFKIHIATKINVLDYVINSRKDKSVKYTLYILTIMDIVRTTKYYLDQLIKEVKIR